MHVKEINIKTRFYNYYFKNLIKTKSKNFLINEKIYNDLVNYFTLTFILLLF